MVGRKLYVFKHESKLGNAPAHALFDLIRVERKGKSEVPARQFSDYTATVDKENIPEGVDLQELL
jgi:CRISPR-associated protein Csd2